MRRIKYLFLICAFLTNICLGKGPTKEEMLKIENEFLAEIKTKKLTNEEIFKLYLEVGDEYSLNSELKLAEHFYSQATKLPGVSDKLPAFYRLLSSLVTLEKLEEAKKRFEALKVYLQNRKISGSDKGKFLMFKVLTSNKLHDEILNEEELIFLKKMPAFLTGFKSHDIKIYFDRSLYQEVLNIYDGRDLSNLIINEKIIIDLASVLKNKQKTPKPLLCQELYEKYPLSRESSYSMIICGMLLKSLNNIKPSQKDFDKVTDSISKKFPDNRYLLNNLKKLL